MIRLRLLILIVLHTVVSLFLDAQIAVRGETVYTMDGRTIADGIVLIKDSKIEAVGSASEITIPENYRLYSGKTVTPGLIDAHSVVGFAGMYNYGHDQDQIEYSNPVQPELRAIDAFNPREGLIEWVRNMGITTLHTGHAPGALASGQTMIVKTTGEMRQSSIVDSAAMIAITLGSGISSRYNSPSTRSKAVAMLRSELIKADEYRSKKDNRDESRRPSRDIKLETFASLLSGDIRALITVHTSHDILAALRIAEEFGFKLVLDGASESYLVTEEIKRAGVPVIIHPTMIRAVGDARNASYTTAETLRSANIPFAFQSGYESYVPKTRIVQYESAIAVANGLPFEAGLAAMTIESARLLGADNRIGSISPGKDADVVIFDGDPFEYITKACVVIINGIVFKEECE
jgi:imidazolonepropionase-like amidohydrolase